MTTETPQPATAEQFDYADGIDTTEPMQCPLEPDGLLLMEFDNEYDIDNYHASILSPLPLLFEPAKGMENEFTPLPTGIPLDNLQQEINNYAATSGGNAIERALSADARNIIFMQQLYDEMEKILGTEDFLIFILLFSPEARENPVGGEFTINYKGRKINLEDAKFTLDIQEYGGEIFSNNEYGDKKMSHVFSSGGSFCTDDFVLKVFKNMYSFSSKKMPYQNYDSSANVAGVVDINKEIIYDMAMSYGLDIISNSIKTPKELAVEIVNITLTQVENNRVIDTIRDTTLEVIDVVATTAALVTGTIALKAAASASIKAIRAGVIALEAGHMIEATDTLKNRMLGEPAPGYNPIRETAKYLDEKAGTEHTIEHCFDALNFMAVLGKTPAMKAFTGITTTTVGGAISVYTGKQI